jgi:hypothetical protein
LVGEPKGPAVCIVASNGHCEAGDHGEGAAVGEDHGKPADAGDNGVTHRTTPTTGSIETGKTHSSGRAVGSSDKGNSPIVD